MPKMKIIIAPDKFKGSLSGIEFCNAVETGLQNISDFQIEKCPLADGGDGTIEVVNYYLQGETIRTIVNDPFFKKIEASYLLNNESKTAFIEMAEASGHKLLKSSELDCKNATTFGTGELIKHAILKGAKTIILGIGGSATNDCGIGMASALGYQFLDSKGNPVTPVGMCLSEIKTIEDSEVIPELKHINIQIACDVDNPLYGPNGAAHVYAKQKGATEDDIIMLNQGLKDFSKILDAFFNVNSQSIKGAGAAGGMGIGTKLFLNGELIPGIDVIKDLSQFNQKVKNADWIITGEGQLDEQTLSGKTIKGVVVSGKHVQSNIAAFCGRISLDQNGLDGLGIDYVDQVMNYAVSLEVALANSKTYVTKMAEVFAEKIV
jgi:glycerate kinase